MIKNAEWGDVDAMYKKGILVLAAAYLVLLMTALGMNCEKLGQNAKSSQKTDIRDLRSGEVIGIARYSSSEERVVKLAVLARPETIVGSICGENEMGEDETYTADELAVLQRIVEAEAGGEDEKGKLLVANVILNRVRSEEFPNSISEVVFQQSNGVTQFSPVKNGRLDMVTVSEETKNAVERALQGEDLSEGALFFAARRYAKKSSMKWFDENLTFLFQHGGHEFFK